MQHIPEQGRIVELLLRKGIECMELFHVKIQQILILFAVKCIIQQYGLVPEYVAFTTSELVHAMQLHNENPSLFEIEAMLDLNRNEGYRPPVLNIIARDNVGIEELLSLIEKHWEYENKSGSYKQKKFKRLKTEVMDIFRESVMRTLYSMSKESNIIDELVYKVIDRQMDPYSAAERLMDELTKK